MKVNKKFITAVASLFILTCGQPEPAAAIPAAITVETPEVQCFYEAGETENVAAQSWRMRRIAEKSREAAVRVYTPDGFVRGTGTYFTMGDHHVIITAAHVVRSYPFMLVSAEGGEETIAITAYLEFDEDEDLAVLLLPAPLESREPIEFRAREDHDGLIGESLVYTGFPGHHDLMTIYGNAAGMQGGNVIMHSYAWPGASGSAVFDSRGRVVGILRAIDVNRAIVGPQLTEDMVWLDPVNNFEIEDVIKFLDVYEILIEEAE
jgi:S1-C subfamily serine protease